MLSPPTTVYTIVHLCRWRTETDGSHVGSPMFGGDQGPSHPRPGYSCMGVPASHRLRTGATASYNVRSSVAIGSSEFLRNATTPPARTTASSANRRPSAETVPGGSASVSIDLPNAATSARSCSTTPSKWARRWVVLRYSRSTALRQTSEQYAWRRPGPEVRRNSRRQAGREQ
jgi:hypothetical protein